MPKSVFYWKAQHHGKHLHVSTLTIWSSSTKRGLNWCFSHNEKNIPVRSTKSCSYDKVCYLRQLGEISEQQDVLCSWLFHCMRMKALFKSVKLCCCALFIYPTKSLACKERVPDLPSLYQDVCWTTFRLPIELHLDFSRFWKWKESV